MEEGEARDFVTMELGSSFLCLDAELTDIKIKSVQGAAEETNGSQFILNQV